MTTLCKTTKPSRRRASLRILLIASCCGLFFSAYAGSAGDPQDSAVRLEPVAGNVSYLTGRGTNMVLLSGEEGVLLVDTMFLELAPDIEAAVDRVTEGELVFLLNTHWHGDHTGGNPHFGKQGVVVAHENVRRRLAGDPEIDGRVAGPEPAAEALPVVTYADGMSLHFAGEEVRLFHVPAAHTDGDTVVWFTGSGVVHLGDLFFQNGYPFIDLESGGGVEGLLAGLEAILAELPDDVRIVPGHGVPTGVDGLREYVTMLETLTGRVREHLAEGLGVDDMMANGVTEDFDERWGGAFIDPRRFVQTLVNDLGR